MLQTFDKVLPVFSVIGKTIKLLGPAGSGQHTKAVNQILIATTMIGLVEVRFSRAVSVTWVHLNVSYRVSCMATKLDSI
jgi:3-hydroxyisobutyrate dehydrogenase-like beta-hydroxyacid dehydrogenase